MGGRCKEGTSATTKQRKGGTVVTPSEAEIEEFFATMERGRIQRLKDKYNYDFEKDKPMDGRYKWVEVDAVDDVGGVN